MKTVVSMKFGSHLYGTNTPESDLDFRAVHLPDYQDILLQRVSGSVSKKRGKKEGEKNLVGEVDLESYSLQRYLGLLVEGQTVAIDMLFTPDAMILESSDIWDEIRANKNRFLTKKSAAFVGYCRTQANKYGIKGSRVAAARVASNTFQGIVDFGGGGKKVGEWHGALVQLVKENPDHMSVVCSDPRPNHTTEQYFECCNRKVPFTASCKLAHEIFSKVFDNYGNRAQLAEQNEGIDWKALSHAVRVGREALELLETGNVTFPLPDAAHILEIKKGLVDYTAVAVEIEGLLEDVEKASTHSQLAERADQAFIDQLVLYHYGQEVRKS